MLRFRIRKFSEIPKELHKPIIDNIYSPVVMVDITKNCFKGIAIVFFIQQFLVFVFHFHGTPDDMLKAYQQYKFYYPLVRRTGTKVAQTGQVYAKNTKLTGEISQLKAEKGTVNPRKVPIHVP